MSEKINLNPSNPSILDHDLELAPISSPFTFPPIFQRIYGFKLRTNLQRYLWLCNPERDVQNLRPLQCGWPQCGGERAVRSISDRDTVPSILGCGARHSYLTEAGSKGSGNMPGPFFIMGKCRYYQINSATVAKGVNLLADEGILYKKRGIGMFVAAGSRALLLAKRKEKF